MSDQAPERIWVAGTPQECGQYFPSQVEAEGAWGGIGVEYTRADLATTDTAAAVTAALREAAESLDARYQGALARSDADPLSEHKSYTASAFGVALADVTALVTPSGTAALDDAIARAVAEKDAEIARLRAGPTVKPLVWVPEDAPCTRFKAEALGGHMMIVELDPKTAPGTYSVGFDFGGLCFKFILAEYDDFQPKYTAPAKFPDLKSAKAAAQADYTARILTALDLPTEGGAL